MKPQATMHKRNATTATKPYFHALGGKRCSKFIPYMLATKFGTMMMTVTAVSRFMMWPRWVKE